MKERPILFSAPMVRAILDGSKTQTRRVFKSFYDDGSWSIKPTILPRYPNHTHDYWLNHDARLAVEIKCPYGQIGDQLWVRETHAIAPRTAYAQSEGLNQVLRPDDNHDAAIFRAGWERSQGGIKWKPSIYMPRWASRIQLEITGVRVEKLQDISDQDAIFEGVDRTNTSINGFAIERYKKLWESINGDGSWEANPWVWVIEFKALAK